MSSLLCIRLAYNLSRLRAITRISESIPDLEFRQLAHEIWFKSGTFHQPQLAVSKQVNSPLRFEVDGAWILLPASWHTWDKVKLQSVLANEMAHVQRNDAGTLLLASLATCLFWFHPLSWFLKSRLAVLAEEACDELVVSHETTPEQYARILIDIADDVRRGRSRLAAGAMAIWAKLFHEA